MLNLNDISKNIINWPRFSKRLVVITFDLGLCVLCTWFAFYLRVEKFININDSNILVTLISISLAIPIFWLFGLYRTIFRFGGQSLILNVALAVGTYGLFYFFIVSIYVIQDIPRSIGIIQPLLLFFGIASSRIIIKYLFISSFFQTNFKNKKKILIYGAGNAGRQILTSLENNP